jgi:hypothetical protein
MVTRLYASACLSTPRQSPRFTRTAEQNWISTANGSGCASSVEAFYSPTFKSTTHTLQLLSLQFRGIMPGNAYVTQAWLSHHSIA